MAPNEKEEHRHAIVIGHVHLDRCNDATNWDETPLFPEKIVDLVTLSRVLPSICSTIFHQIGSQQVEATYQRCLQVDLKAAGIPTVILEPEIHLLYKGQIVGSRRPDIFLKLHSGESALLELKAVNEMTIDHMIQLEYYLHSTGIEKGYLINFPHDCRFPTVKDKSSFIVNLLNGMKKKVEHLLSSGHSLRLQNSPQKRQVEVLEVTRRTLTKDEQKAIRIEQENKPQPKFGIKANGEECKICIREGKFCRFHLSQKPS